MIERCAQNCRAYRLVEQVVTARAGLTEAFRGGVAAHEEGRDRSAERVTQVLNGFEAGSPLRQLVVGKDQIGPAIVTAEARQRCAIRFSCYHPASPTLQQPAHAIEDKLIVVDDDDELAPRWIGDALRR